jgi:RNA polymerase sigma factor (sigma-70 family)
MAENESFETMVERAFSGNGIEFNELYKLIYHSAHKITGNHHAAEDVAGEVLKKLWQEWQVQAVRNRSKLRSWVFQVTHNEAVDYLRKIHSDISLDRVEDPDESPLRDFFATECPEEIPEVYAEHEELQRFIWQALNSVSEINRSCLICRFVEKMTIEEIATLHDRSTRQILRYIGL